MTIENVLTENYHISVIHMENTAILNDNILHC